MADYTLSAKITGDSSGFEKAFSTAQKALDSFQSKIEGVSAKFESISQKLSSVAGAFAPVSAAAAGAGVAAGKMALNFEDSMANINTLLDDSSHLVGYESAVKKISNETGLSLDNMSQGMYQAISSLGDGGKETEKIFNTMARSAKAGGAEVADSVALISAGMKGYNDISGETAQKISDLAFQTAKLGVTTFPEMAKSMQPLFPLANSLNLSFEDLFGSMATLTGVTGNTAEVSTQLKAVFSNLMAPTTSMQKMIEKYGYASGQAMLQSEGFAGMLEIVKNETGGQADKMAELFSSTEAVTAMTALTSSQFDTFKDKLSQMGDAAGSTEAAYEKLRTNGDRLRASWNKIKNAGVELGSTMIDMVAPKIEILSDKISRFSNYFSEASESTKRFIVIIGAVVAAIAPALMIMSKLASGLSLGLKVISAISSPVGIALTAISALAAGFVYLMNTNESFRDGVLSVWDSISGKIGAVVSGLIPIVSSAFESIKVKFQGMIDAISSMDFSIVFAGLQLFAQNAKAFVSSIDFSGIAEKLQSMAERIRDFVSKIDFSAIADKVKVLITLFGEIASNIDPIIGVISDKVHGLCTIFQIAFSGLNIPVSAFMAGFIGILVKCHGPLSTFASKAVSVGSSIAKGIGTAIPQVLPALTNFFARFQAGGGVIGLVKSGISGLGSAITGLLNPVTLIVGAIALLVAGFATLMATNEGFRNTVIGLGQSILTSLLPVFQMIGQTISQIISTVMPVLISLFNQMLPIIGQIAIVILQIGAALAPMITQLIGSLLPVITNIITVLSNVISSVMPALIAILNVIMSVLQTLTPIIMDILSVVISVVSGIISAVNPVISFIGSVISAIMAVISPIVTFIADIIASVIQVIGTIIGTATGIFSTVFSIVSGVFSNISNFISTVINAISTVISTLTGVVGGVFNGIYSVVSSVMGNVRNFITGVFNAIKSSWNGLTSFVNGVFSGIGAAVNQLVSQVKGFVNGVISGINAAVGLINMIPGVSIGYIPYLARGTDDWQGGFARMNEGERGELTYLPNGAQVIPHDISVKYAKEAARVNNNSADGAVIDYDRLINGIAAAMSGVKVESSMNVGGRTLAKVIAPLVDDRMGLLNARAGMG